MNIDPRQLRALIVGVDTYQGGWNLRGAVRDAFRFARWLQACDVPPNNLWLCLAGEDLEALYASHPQLAGVHKCGASRESVAAALNECLKEVQGDFCLFWGGHGVLDINHSHYLICADAAQADLKSFRLQDIRAHLRAEAVADANPSRLQRSVIIVDACSNYAPVLKFEQNLTPYPFPKGAVAVEGRRQCVVVSSRPGDFAKEDRIQRTGHFSRQLLAHLQAPANLDTLFDLKTVNASIQRTFAELRTERQSDQVPTYSEWTDWDANDPDVTGSPRVDALESSNFNPEIGRTELDSLLLIVEAVPEAVPAAIARDAFNRLVPCGDSPPQSLSAPAVFRHCLREIALGLGCRFLLIFLELCRPSLDKAGIGNPVRTWEANVAERLRLKLPELHGRACELAKRAALPAAPIALLRVVQVVVQPQLGQILGVNRYQLWARVWADQTDDDVPPKQSEDSVQTRDELKSLLAHLCLQMIDGIPTGNSVLVEVILPAELLGHGVANWTFNRGERVVSLGHDFELALRSFERGYELAFAGPRLASRNKWQTIIGGLKQQNVAWLPPQSTRVAISFDTWDDEEIAALCAHSLALHDPVHRQECIAHLLDAGIPLAVWFLDSPTPPAQWKTKLRKDFVARPHAEWPGVARRFRRLANGKSYHLAVLLDDPTRPLPPLPGSGSSALRAPSSGSLS